MHALIAEDEPILAQTLRAALARLWPELEVSLAADGFEAVEQALATRPDMLFLDIKMPGKSGLEAAQELAEDWPDDAPFPLIVFVTAYDEYALQAFEHAAVDYLLKPVADARLAETVKRLRQRLDEQRTGPQGDALARLLAGLQTLAPPAPPAPPAQRLDFIRAAVGNQIRMIPVSDVLYFQATDKYLCVVTADGEALIRTSLKELLPQLDPACFWQIHRGTVVNTACIEAAVRDDSGKLALRLRGQTATLAVSRLYAHLFRAM